MIRPLFASIIATAIATAPVAQSVSLQSVTIDADDNVTVVYSKNFATCAHLYFSNASCSVSSSITHAQNIFCTAGTNVTVTRPLTSFHAGFQAGSIVRMVHGNNAGIVSACVTIECDGSYGNGCAPAGGVAPVLGAADACPPAGTSVDLQLTNATISSLSVLGLGLTRINAPVLGCDLLVGTVLGSVVVPIDGSGAGAFSLPIPAGIAGFEMTAQAFVIDGAGPQGFTGTNGMLVRIR